MGWGVRRMTFVDAGKARCMRFTPMLVFAARRCFSTALVAVHVPNSLKFIPNPLGFDGILARSSRFGQVSFSNPVRQSLFTHQDAAQGRQKATAAREAVEAILPDAECMDVPWFAGRLGRFEVDSRWF